MPPVECLRLRLVSVRDLRTPASLVLVGPARPYGDVDVHDAVIAVHPKIIAVVAEHPGGPVVAGEDLEQVILGYPESVDERRSSVR